MAWVREKNPKRKPSAPQRDPKDSLEGFLSYLACKPPPNASIQRYLREQQPKHQEKPEIVPREPTVYGEDEIQHEDEDDYDSAPIQNQRRRGHHYHHHSQIDSPQRRTPASRHVSNVEARLYRPKTSVQTRRVVSSWSNATTPLAI